MTVFFVHPGTTAHSAAKDIAVYLARGFRASGVEVIEFDLTPRLYLASTSFSLLQKAGITGPYGDEEVKAWAGSGVVEAAVLAEADLIFIVKGHQLTTSTLAALKKLSVPMALWTLDDPYEHRENYERAVWFDAVFTEESACLDSYRSRETRAALLPFAHDPSVHAPRSSRLPEQYQSDLCMVGRGFKRRIALLEALLQKQPRLRLSLVGDWSDVPTRSPLFPCLGPKRVSAQEAVRYYQASKIVINIHRDEEDSTGLAGIIAASPNPRTFEAAGCRSFQLVDASRTGIAECFAPGVEITQFSSADDLQDKVDYYLSHGDERRSIAEAAHRKSLSAHTYTHRAAQVLSAF